MNLNARKMSGEDIPFINYVYEQNRAILHGNHISLGEWTNYFANTDTSGGSDPYESHHIILADDVPAAWLKINAWNKPEVYISMLAVDDAFKRKGVGMFAVQFAERQARHWGKSAVLVQTTRDNVSAKECCLKCGYEITREMIYKTGDGIDREGYEFKKTILPEALTEEKLIAALIKMFGAPIIRACFQSRQLQGGTVGDVRLVEGVAESADGAKLPYRIILKTQRKWNRPGDFDSWRREYDLYASDFGKLFNESFRWAECYRAEIADGGWELWLEYADGVSGESLSEDMLEQAALELGRFQGRIYRRPDLLERAIFLSDAGVMERDFAQWEPATVEYQYLRYTKSEIPENLHKYIHSDKNEIPEHLRAMLIGAHRRIDETLAGIRRLPIVLCHRDFWTENIFFADGKITLIDWDGAGWGFMGEDIASLVVDDTPHERWHEYYRKFTAAYQKGLSEYMDIPALDNYFIWEMIIIKFGYRMLQDHMFAETDGRRKSAIEKLQKIYDMRTC